MKYFIRLFIFFVLAAIIWGLIVGLVLALVFGISKAILYGIGAGFIFSFIITVGGALYDFYFRRLVFLKYGIKSFDVTQYREINIIGDVDDIYKRSITALKLIPDIEGVSPNFSAKTILANTRKSIRTFGEIIELKLFQEDDEVLIRICSKPRRKTAIIDCGKNIENVEIFCKLITTDKNQNMFLERLAIPFGTKAIASLLPFIILALVISIVIIINN